MSDNLTTSTSSRAQKTERTSRRRNGQRLTKDERATAQEQFLKTFAYSANVMAACRVAGVDRSIIHYWLEHDEAFSLRYHQAELDAADVLRAEMFRRAVQGVEEPVTSMGRIVKDDQGRPLTVKKYSDALLTTLAKARISEFREPTKIEISGRDGGPIQSQQTVALDVRGMSAEQLTALRQVLEYGNDSHPR